VSTVCAVASAFAGDWVTRQIVESGEVPPATTLVCGLRRRTSVTCSGCRVAALVLNPRYSVRVRW